MRKITINNFGPINNVELELDKNINIVIGAQASGKSTLSKTIYFCRKVRDYLVEYLIDSSNFKDTHVNELYINFLKYIRKNFMGFFGTTKHIPPFRIKYLYNEAEGVYIDLSLEKDGYAKIVFSKDLNQKIKQVIFEAQKIHSDLTDNSNYSFLERYNQETQKLNFSYKHFKEIACSLFEDSDTLIYIPAGRSVLATFSEQLYDVNVTHMDTTMQEFINLTRNTRKKFNSKLPEIVSNYTKTVKGQINNADVDLAIVLINKILKANYVYDRDGEKIYYDKDKWIKLMFASSGQQESLWSLMLMFSFILEKQTVFLVLEEPEAHLFPEAQKYIVELISLFCNSTNSSVILTTHSPYILTSLNLLIHSYRVENDKKTLQEDRIIPKNCRLNQRKVTANMILSNAQNNLQDITDEETGFIDAVVIDSVSQIINAETEKLINLEIKYDL